MLQNNIYDYTDMFEASVRVGRRICAEELAKMENELSDFALSYFDFSKYADDLFDTDFWYKDGYVFHNN